MFPTEAKVGGERVLECKVHLYFPAITFGVISSVHIKTVMKVSHCITITSNSIHACVRGVYWQLHSAHRHKCPF